MVVFVECIVIIDACIFYVLNDDCTVVKLMLYYRCLFACIGAFPCPPVLG